MKSEEISMGPKKIFWDKKNPWNKKKAGFWNKRIFLQRDFSIMAVQDSPEGKTGTFRTMISFYLEF